MNQLVSEPHVIVQGFTVDIYTVDASHCDKDRGENSSDITNGLPEGSATGHTHSSPSFAPPLVHVGRTSILPQQYLVLDKTQGTIILTVFSPELLSIGAVACMYMYTCI